MKVAICGAGPLGLEMALKMTSLGTDVTLFEHEMVGGSLAKMARLFPAYFLGGSWQEITTSLGRSAAAWKDSNTEPAALNYLEQYLLPLWHKLAPEIRLRSHKVMRIQKRFLNPEENIPGKKRIHDLFRVVYKMDPKESIELELGANPEAFKKLDADVLRGLKNPIENYEDFDVVIDTMGATVHPLPLGMSRSEALNESYYREFGIYYGMNAVEKASVELPAKKLMLVGSGETAALALIALEKKLFDSNDTELVLVTRESSAFEQWLKATPDCFQSKKLRAILQMNQTLLTSAFAVYSVSLKEWEELEDYQKVKVKKPAPPRAKIEFWNGHGIQAVDRLEHNSGLYITCDRVDFGSTIGALKTVNVDVVLACTGYADKEEVYPGLKLCRETDSWKYLASIEPGFYRLGRSLSQGLGQIDGVVNDLLSYFTRAEQ